MISFENTEVAFSGKSNKDLKRGHLLFRVIAYPWMVKFGAWFTHFAFKVHLPVKGIIKRTIFRQFCGGESINECDAAISHLDKYGIGTILDYSVEGKESDADFESTTNEIIQTIRKATNNVKIPFAVFKVTGIARFSLLEKANDITYILQEKDQKEYNQTLARVERICQVAHDAGVPVFIDAEETWIQDAIDRMATTMMRKFNKERAIVFNTVQMYRHDRLEHLRGAIEHAIQEKYHYGVKLVRGAYMEKERARAEQKGYPSPIQNDKNSTDKDYDSALRLILDNLKHCSLCAGTHNEESSQHLVQLLIEKGIDKSNPSVYFAQLLGMSDHISFNLSHEGYKVAKYVPYGPVKEVMPYLLRRAQENTSVAGQTGRELSLIEREVKRRKAAKK